MGTLCMLLDGPPSECQTVRRQHPLQYPLRLTIPSSAREYCDYLSQGYLGYTWESSAGDYSCAPSARKSSNGATNFCVWEDGSLEVSIPSGSAADCGSLSQGRIGWLLPGGTVSI